MFGLDEGGLPSVGCRVGFIGFGRKVVGGEFCHGLLHVLDFPADMMKSFAVSIKVGRERVLGAERLDELEADVSHVEMSEPHSHVIEDLAQQFRKSKLIAVKGEGGLGVANDDGDVIDFLEHVAT